MRKRVSKDNPAPTLRSPTIGPRDTNVTYAEDLVQSHVGSLVSDSVFLSPYEPMIVQSVGLRIMSLSPMDPTVLSLCLFHDSPSSA